MFKLLDVYDVFYEIKVVFVFSYFRDCFVRIFKWILEFFLVFMEFIVGCVYIVVSGFLY